MPTPLCVLIACIHEIALDVPAFSARFGVTAKYPPGRQGHCFTTNRALATVTGLGTPSRFAIHVNRYLPGHPLPPGARVEGRLEGRQGAQLVRGGLSGAHAERSRAESHKLPSIGPSTLSRTRTDRARLPLGGGNAPGDDQKRTAMKKLLARAVSAVEHLRIWLLRQPWFLGVLLPALPRRVRWMLRKIYLAPVDIADRLLGRQQDWLRPRQILSPVAWPTSRVAGRCSSRRSLTSPG